MRWMILAFVSVLSAGCVSSTSTECVDISWWCQNSEYFYWNSMEELVNTPVRLERFITDYNETREVLCR